ncbi:D-inositol-3-phosphate glycosyltransferase [bioreactor metagenome]|uniref:D-inositol-3-phosphate glycosyltransferase n=1 Tax=bioreactor metagenome TaxID=1076179 RepID=A0A645DTJ9_9ZZZZ
MVKQKGIALAVDFCTKNNLPLYVVGDGDEYYFLKKRAGKTIKFFRKCNDKRKMKLLAQAKALIYPSIEEDFGIVPVEAMSVGTPVIGFASGGVKETIENGLTGVLFYKHSIESLEKAINKFNDLKWNQNICYQQAKKFSEKIFVMKIKELINEEL